MKNCLRKKEGWLAPRLKRFLFWVFEDLGMNVFLIFETLFSTVLVGTVSANERFSSEKGFFINLGERKVDPCFTNLCEDFFVFINEFALLFEINPKREQ